jgi:predicted TPR repeat methyltransferase
MGNLLSSRGRINEAVAYYCKAIRLMPDYPQSRKLLEIAYYMIGQIDAAAQVYFRWLQDEPENPVALHMHAACSGQQVPARASDAYVETTFDDFAASFDVKLGPLAYRAPELVAEALATACPVPQQSLVGLDAGCGTGLCAPLLRPYVDRLTGVDLSSGMLAQARTRSAYDVLVKAELTAYLSDHSDAFDLIVSAETLVYFGALNEVLIAARRALRRAGWLIFTVEEGANVGAGYRINPHGRYSHDDMYVRQALVEAGLCVVAIVHQVLRMESGNPVHGLVVTASSLD